MSEETRTDITTNAERQRQTTIVARHTGRLWCSTCQGEQPADRGTYRPLKNGARRWICGTCSARIKGRQA